MSTQMRDVVKIEGHFKPSVQLPGDFYNEDHNQHFTRTYIPTRQTIDVFMQIRDSLQPQSTKRARQYNGTFGTGKSDLMLMVANFVTRPPDDPLLAPLFERMRHLDHSKTEAILQARRNKPPFLLVLLHTEYATTFSAFVIDGLQRALEQAGLADFMTDTYYGAALSQLDTWERDSPRIKEIIEGRLGEDYRMTLGQLRTDLRGSRGDDALRIFRDVVQRGLGIPFSPSGSVAAPAQAFAEVAHKLVDSGEYSGIFLICDEFTRLLERMSAAPEGADIDAVQSMIEVAQRSGSAQVHFNVTSLEPFTAAHGSTASQKYLEKIGGRFEHTTLQTQNAEELIDAAILNPQQPYARATAQRDELIEYAGRLWRDRGKHWITSTGVDGCFPLHPLTTYCLPLLNRILAQNERTMFRFIQDEDGGLKQFIDRTPAEPDAEGWIPLFTLDMLFDYFRDNLEHKEDRWYAYQHARQRASERVDPEDLESGLDGKILRALLMLEVVSGDSNLRVNIETLQHAMGLPPIKRVEFLKYLSRLEEVGAIYRSPQDTYALGIQGRVSPQELRHQIDQRAAMLQGSPIEALNQDYRLAAQLVPAMDYNAQYGTSRELSARFVTLAGLKTASTIAALKPMYGGLLLYVIAGAEELADARLEAAQATRDYSGVVVAVPREPSDLLIRFNQARAIQEMRHDDQYKGEAYQELLSDTSRIGRDYKQYLDQARSLYNQVGSFDWYYKGETKNITNQDKLRALASEVMRDLFPATPPHSVAQHIKAGGTSKPVKAAVSSLLVGHVVVQSKGHSPETMVVRDGVMALGLLKSEGTDGGYERFTVIAPPDEPRYRASRAVWDLLERSLYQGQRWAEIAGKLKSSPYGMYSHLIQIYFAAVLRVNRDQFEVYKVEKARTETPIELNADVVADMVDNPTRYEIRLQPLMHGQRILLEQLLEQVLLPALGKDGQEHEGSVRTHVASLLRRWYGGLPGICQALSGDHLQILKQFQIPGRGVHYTDADVMAARLLLEIGSKSSDTEVAHDLLTYLPRELGMPADPELWTTQDIQKEMFFLERAARALDGFQGHFTQYMAKRVGARFSTDPLPEHWDEWLLERARTWASQHAAKVSSEDVRHDRYASLLLDALNSLERSSSRVFFSGMLVSAILGSPKPNGVYQWTSVSEEGVYLRALDSALRVIVEEADKSPVGTDGRDEQVGVGSMDGTMTIEMLDADDAYADLKYILDRVHTNQRVQLLEKLLKEYSR